MPAATITTGCAPDLSSRVGQPPQAGDADVGERVAARPDRPASAAASRAPARPRCRPSPRRPGPGPRSGGAAPNTPCARPGSSRAARRSAERSRFSGSRRVSSSEAPPRPARRPGSRRSARASCRRRRSPPPARSARARAKSRLNSSATLTAGPRALDQEGAADPVGRERGRAPARRAGASVPDAGPEAVARSVAAEGGEARRIELHHHALGAHPAADGALAPPRRERPADQPLDGVDQAQHLRLDRDAGLDPARQAGRGRQFRHGAEAEVAGERPDRRLVDAGLDVGVAHPVLAGGVEAGAVFAEVVGVGARHDLRGR